MSKYIITRDEINAIEFFQSDIEIHREKYKEIEKKGEPIGYGTMHDMHKLYIVEDTLILNLINKLLDVIENNANYVICEYCGNQFKAKLSTAKYCSKNCNVKSYWNRLTLDERRAKRQAKEYKAEYRKNHKDKIKAYMAEYRKKHKDKIKEYNARYREKQKHKEV